jgi:hypothetical protein
MNKKSRKDKESSIPKSLEEVLDNLPTAANYVSDHSISGFELRVYDAMGNLIEWCYPTTFNVPSGKYSLTIQESGSAKA